MLKKVPSIIYHKKYIQIENSGSHLAFSHFAAGDMCGDTTGDL